MALDTLEDFSDIVSDIYDCAVDERLWTPLLNRLCQKMDGAYVTLGMSPVQHHDWSIQYTSTFDMDVLRRAGQYAPNIPGLSGVITAPVDEPFSTLTRVSEAEAHASPFFQEWVLPNGLRDGSIIKYVENDRILGTLSFVTGQDRGPITVEELECLRRLSPHFRRAMMIADSIQRRTVLPDAYRVELEAMTLPILIVDAEGRLRFLNGAADTLLSQANVLMLKQGRVEPVSGIAAPAVAEAIACAASNDVLLGRRGVGLRLADHRGGARFAYILPIGRTQARTFGGPGAAIFITDSDRQRPPPVAVLMTMLDLNPHEARVALAVAEGRNTDEAAEALGVPADSVQMHLRAVFAKLGISRPAELARIARALSFPAAIDPAGALPGVVR